MATYYPDRASRMSVSGHATMECTVTASGAVSGCSVIAENPPDYGFGEAALRLAKLFKMRPMSRDGVPVEGGKVIIPIGFTIPKE